MNYKNFLFYLPRKPITKLRYYYSTGKRLNLKEPQDFNQKIVYLMLNEFGIKEQNCADKYLVRKYVERKGKKEILTKLYGCYESAEGIDFDKLPEEYVLKTNHGCGCTFIKTKNNSINIKSVKEELNKSLKKNYAKETLEYQYANIKPCILCEEYLKENGKLMPTDYKIFCFNGKAQFLLVIGDRENEIKKMYYDLSWNEIDCTREKMNVKFSKPENFEEMIRIAEKLSEDFKFVRVDLYNIDGKIYFGELTFTPHGGINNTIKQEYLDEWGKMLK